VSAASQDAVMQSFEQLVDKLRVHEVDNFKGWLYVFARNFCLMELRKGKHTTHVDIEENMSESEQKLSDSGEERWEEEDFDKMHACIGSLSKSSSSHQI